MGFRLSKIYTRTGDSGDTGLAGNQRITKHHPRIAAMAAIDELNSGLGMLRTYPLPADLSATFLRVQHQLFQVGAELALPGHPCVNAADITFLEQAIDHFNADLPPLKEFILPGGTPSAAYCHLVRAICRRAETQCAALHACDPLSEPLRGYINRLSDFLFVAARWLNLAAGTPETLWQPDWR